MRAAAVKPRDVSAREFDWARLIPGEIPAIRGEKKGPQPVRETGCRTLEEDAPAATIPVAFLTPRPLCSRAAWTWLRSVITDWAVIAANWLLLGALIVSLRMVFPQISSSRYEDNDPAALIGMAVLHAALITLVAYSEGINVCRSDLRAQARILAKSIVSATSVLCCAFLLLRTPWVIMAMICLAGPLHFAGLVGWRWRFQQHERSGLRSDCRNVVIVGANPVGRHLASSIQQDLSGERRFCGFLDNDNPRSHGVIAAISDLARVARQQFIDEIILAAPNASDVTRQVLNEARRLRLDVEIVPAVFGCRVDDPEIEQLGGMPVICLHTERLPSAGLFLKRTVDVIISAALLVALAPLFAAIALLIKLDSPGPVFYRAQRAGRKGSSFACHKFRTMVTNAEALKLQLRENNQREGPFFKIADDPRITRVGHYLRRYSLDELPQLWNVLKGEMSLVGPRPHPVEEYAAYSLGDLGRLDITPGITGLWQVTARRDPSFQRAMELDREYIQTWNLALDLRILLRTIVAVAQGSGQ